MGEPTAKEWAIAREITRLGWCDACHKIWDEHLTDARPHNYRKDLTEPIARALHLLASQPDGGGA